MLVMLATAGGFGGDFGAWPPDYTLAPDAGPKLLVGAVLVALLGCWGWLRLRSLER